MTTLAEGTMGFHQAIIVRCTADEKKYTAWVVDLSRLGSLATPVPNNEQGNATATGSTLTTAILGSLPTLST